MKQITVRLDEGEELYLMRLVKKGYYKNISVAVRASICALGELEDRGMVQKATVCFPPRTAATS